MDSNSIRQILVIDYLWGLPSGALDDDRRAIQHLVTLFGATECDAKRAVMFGPHWGEEDN